MKRVLLGTTALVAIGAFVGVAQADDMMGPVKVGLGGYYRAALTAYSGDDTGLRGHTLEQNIELEAAGETTLDNGLTVGVRIRVNGNNSGPHNHDDGDAGGNFNTDETEIIVSGGFGRLHIGTIESAAQNAIIWAPGGTAVTGVNSPWFGWHGGRTIATYNDGIGEEDASKIVYYSPGFNGISLALSYAPDDEAVNYKAGGANNGGQQSEQISAALNYAQEVMGGSFSANVGYETHTTETAGSAKCDDMMTNCDPDILRFGAALSIDDISIGGGVMQADEEGNNTRTVSDFGIGYSMGSTSFGLQWGNQSSEAAMDGKGADTSIYALNIGYDLGPGIALGMQLAMGTVEGGGPKKDGMPTDNDWSHFILGTAITF